MKLYENKREVELWQALKMMFCDGVPGHNFEYMITFDEVTRVAAFGKTWTKKDIHRWGELVPKFWHHQEYCPVLSYDDIDVFLVELFNDSGLKKQLGCKKFHVWEEVK